LTGRGLLVSSAAHSTFPLEFVGDAPGNDAAPETGYHNDNWSGTKINDGHLLAPLHKEKTKRIQANMSLSTYCIFLMFSISLYYLQINILASKLIV